MHYRAVRRSQKVNKSEKFMAIFALINMLEKKIYTLRLYTQRCSITPLLTSLDTGLVRSNVDCQIFQSFAGAGGPSERSTLKNLQIWQKFGKK